MRLLSLLLLLIAADAHAQFAEPLDVLFTLSGNAGEFFGDCIDRLDDVDGDHVNDFVVGAPFGAAGGRAVVYSGRTGTPLFEIRADRSGMQVGWEVANAGDVTGDGVSDVLVAAPANGAGSLSVYSGAAHTLVRTVSGEQAGDRFAERIARIRDVDGDGVNDFVAGAPMQGANDAGAVYVFSGASGQRLVVLRGDAAGDHFGSAVASIRDLDGDGVGDIGIGADSAGSDHRGRVYVVSGRTRERIRTFTGDPDGTNFGRYYLGNFIDVDGDAVDELVTADIAHSSRGANTGRSYVVSGRTGEILRRYSGTGSGQFFGTGTKAGADWNGDTVSDLFVGAAFDGTGGELAGRANFYSGLTGALLLTVAGTRAGATLGARGVDLGDLDGDGLPEFLLTAPTDPGGGDRAGRVYVIRGTSFPRTPIAPGKRRRAVHP